MKQIIKIKKEKKLLSLQTSLKFVYTIEYNTEKKQFENFDLGNEIEKIETILSSLNEEKIQQLNNNNQIYLSLTTLFFKELPKLNEIEFENNIMISQIKRSDLN